MFLLTDVCAEQAIGRVSHLTIAMQVMIDVYFCVSGCTPIKSLSKLTLLARLHISPSELSSATRLPKRSSCQVSLAFYRACSSVYAMQQLSVSHLTDLSPPLHLLLLKMLLLRRRSLMRLTAKHSQLQAGLRQTSPTPIPQHLYSLAHK